MEICLTEGGCSLAVAGQIAFETIPIHLKGEATVDFTDTDAITIKATGYNGYVLNNDGSVKP